MQTTKKIPIKVIYVEDDETVLKNNLNYLKKHIKEVYTAKNGKDGLELFFKNSPDAIITDFEMPVMDGLEMIKQIKEHKPDTPIFVTTSFENDAIQLAQAIDYGITQYISKRSDPKRLFESIFDYFKNSDKFLFSLKLCEDGKIAYIDDRFSYFLGYEPEELLEKKIEYIIEEPSLYAINQIFINSIKNREALESVHSIFKNKNGHNTLLSGSVTIDSCSNKILTKWHPTDTILYSNGKIKEKLKREEYLKSLMKYHAKINEEMVTSSNIEEFLQKFINELPTNKNSFGFLLMKIESLNKKVYTPLDSNFIDVKDFEDYELGSDKWKKTCLSCSLAFKYKQIVFIDDISSLDNGISENFKRYGIKTVISIPLNIKLKNSPVGILTLLFTKSHTFDKEELELWQNIANSVAFGIESIKARLERDSLIKKLDLLAHTDKLTGALNRHRGVELLLHEIRRAERYKHPFSIIYLDIDHFKKINDTYGHIVGDRVLISTVQTLKSILRATDSLIRWGGEEFLILLPETSLSDAVHIAQKLRKEIEKRATNIPVPITASFGISTWEEGQTMDSLLHRADSKMYESKKLGRNRISY